METNHDCRLQRFLTCAVAAAVLLLLAGCGNEFTGELPIHRIRAELADVTTYSVVLEDMKEEGNFIRSYYHKYRIIRETKAQTTDWMEVSKDFYRANEENLGMSLLSRKEGQEITTVSPPGYHYVGDSRYGKWSTDRSGNTFWEWYGKYALFSSLFGGWYRPVYMRDYNTYDQYRSQNRTYYGRDRQYGSSGSIARQTKPNFYQRHMARQQSRSSSFANKVSSRIGRTKTGFRGRSGGFGK